MPRGPLCQPGIRHAGGQRRFDSGFTLIELLIALVIAGILLTIALPGYQLALIKSSRAAARGALLDILSRQEQYFVNHKRYAVSLDSLGVGKDHFVDRQGDAVSRDLAAYDIRLVLIDGAYGGVEAIPVNAQAADSGCMTFSVSRIGTRSVSGARSPTPSECW